MQSFEFRFSISLQKTKKAGDNQPFRDPRGIRTPNQQNRNLPFYPVELWSLTCGKSKKLFVFLTLKSACFEKPRFSDPKIVVLIYLSSLVFIHKLLEICNLIISPFMNSDLLFTTYLSFKRFSKSNNSSLNLAASIKSSSFAAFSIDFLV